MSPSKIKQAFVENQSRLAAEERKKKKEIEELLRAAEAEHRKAEAENEPARVVNSSRVATKRTKDHTTPLKLKLNEVMRTDNSRDIPSRAETGNATVPVPLLTKVERDAKKALDNGALRKRGKKKS